MRWIELSSPTLVARMSKAPNWFTVPLATSSPSDLSTGSDSPVITAWSTEVCPPVITPSTGMVSPGSTRSISPTCTACASIVSSPRGVMRRAVRGVRRTSFSIPARAFATVSSSSRPPSCMIKATSPAAKSSPISTDATSASDTSTSALMSKAVTRPITASRTIGTPQRIIATHAASNGRGGTPAILAASAAPEMARKTISRFMPPHSRTRSKNFTAKPPYTHIGICILYPYGYKLSSRK